MLHYFLGFYLSAVAPPSAPVPTTETEAPPAQTEEPEYKRYPRGFKPPGPGIGFFGLAIPEPIGDSEWASYARQLIVSDAQQQLFAALYDQYRRDDWEFRMKEAQPLWDRSAELHALGDVGTSVATATVMAQLLDDRNKLLPRISAIEDHLFSSIGAYLSDAQLWQLEKVKHRRVRTRCNEVDCPFPGSMIDLEVVLDQFAERGLDIAANDLAIYAQTIDEYRVLVTPASIERSKSVLENAGQIHVLMAHMQELAARGQSTMEELVAIKDRCRALRGEWVRSGIRIHNLNRDFHERLANLLPAPTASALRRYWHETVFPVVYPDPYELGSLIEQVRLIEDIPSKDRKDIEDAIVAYESQRDQLNLRMAKRYLEWSEYTCERMGFKFDPYYQYRDEMQEIQRSRKANADATITIVRAHLTPEQLESKPIADALRAYEREGAKHEARVATATAQHGWPGPYD